MLELAEEIAALRRELQAWRERGRAGTPGPGGEGEAQGDERPPHY